jgi:hypothetical protein
VTTATLTLVGDIALGDHPKAVGFGFHSRYPTGIPASLSPRLLPPGARTDAIIGNLEFALGPPIPTSATLAERQCRGLSEYVAFLAAAGVRALNVANNHSSQHGTDLFRSTVDAVRAAGIHVIGTADDFGESGVLRIGPLRVALLGWSQRPRQYDGREPPYNEFSDAAFDQIAAARARADVVIASIHWGDEFILLPREEERRTARALLDAGATIVWGHHPHVVREVERHDAGLIAYSMGNFVGDMLWDCRTRFTGWLNAVVGAEGVRSTTLEPGIIADDYLPRPLVEREHGDLPVRIEAARDRQSRGVEAVGYDRVAREAHRRHVRRTAWMMLRSLPRYPRGAVVELFGGAIRNRLRRAAPLV